MFDSQLVTIIIVEDEPGHSKLIEKNLRRGGLENQILILENGQQALDYLKELSDAQPPINHCFLLLLDLNMPIMSGVELLRKLKQDQKLREIPVIVLTSSDDQREIDECYRLGCNLYIPKPVEFNRFSEVIRELGLMIGLIAAPSLN